MGIGFTFDFLQAEFDAQNRKIIWRGDLKPFRSAAKMPASVKGQWLNKKFILNARFGKKSCSSVFNKN